MNQSYDEHFCALGERRLCSWGLWCAGDTAKKLKMPSQSPFARLYQPELGDVWAEPGEIEPESLIDDSEAEKVEAAVLKMDDADRYLLMLAYVYRYPVTSKHKNMPTIVRRMRSSEIAVNAALSRITEVIGQLRF